ncbi:unnamed protein product [Clonostachys rosea]|uniref:Pex19-domain-containing protein n=1 Tax=Bionectria ochroleuca TaxID=29856 RepID=A0ABY6U3E1_BIOOC|nr:unnamed protein product [Clonostachys rosea]
MSTAEDIKKEGAGAGSEHVIPTASSGNAASKTEEPKVEDFPDPDEDDLDDLDDMLDEFSSVKIDAKPATASSNPSPPTVAPASIPKTEPAPAAAPVPEPSVEEDLSEEEFAKQLQAGMADLLGQLDSSPDMQAQFEDMFKKMNEAAEEAGLGEEAGKSTEGNAKSTPGPQAAQANDASFQDTIRRTMERMQNSGDQATAAAASGGENDFMSEMLKQLSSGELGGEGGDEEFSKMLMGMMEQLTNKEILYEPMKELHDKFPAWLEKNRAATPADDLKRYDLQQKLVNEIVAKFEERTYSDSNAADREYIVDRMQKMQEAGSPPSDLVGSMPSAQEALSMPDDQCNPQ